MSAQVESGFSTPVLQDYPALKTSFQWKDAFALLGGLPEHKGLNIAYEAVDRHAASALAQRTAIRWIRKDRTSRDFTYSELRDLTNQFANVLEQLRIQKGDRVFAFTGRIPELYISALGTLKKAAVFCPLFSVFGPEPVLQSLSCGNLIS